MLGQTYNRAEFLMVIMPKFVSKNTVQLNRKSILTIGILVLCHITCGCEGGKQSMRTSNEQYFFDQRFSQVDLSVDSSLVVGRSPEKILIWEFSTHKPRISVKLHGCGQVAITRDGKYLVAEDNSDGEIVIFDSTNAQRLLSVPGSGFALAEGNEIMIAEDNFFKYYNFVERQTVNSIDTGMVKPFCLARSTEGLFAVAGSIGAHLDRIILWHPSTGKKTKIMSDVKGPIHSLSFSTDGKWLASADYGNNITVWDVAKNEMIYLNSYGDNGHFGEKSLDHYRLFARFYPNSSFLAVCCSGDKEHPGLLYLIDVTTKREITTLRLHDSVLLSFVFSNDGKTLLTSGLDGVKVWNTKRLFAQ